jgi:nitrogenase molybdenum-cofactor synthesis protein NifE
MDTCRDNKIDILFAGGRYLYPALKSRIPFLDINHERDFGYEGYTGIVELARQIALAVDNPIWRQIRRPPSWRLLRVAKAVGI